ncbi:MAG TPA: hypothetical protein VGR37_21800 [Longimicrobiaceae bacterium]|nr:hypothetical protein [Longimicrobiaceae bacterium]
MKVRLAPGAVPAQPVQALAAALPEQAWQEIEVAEGAQGPRLYRFARLRVWESRDGLPGRECRLLLRTNLEGEEPRYALSNAPAEAELGRLAQVQTTRWRVETEFETLKGEVGLDEVRGTRLAWVASPHPALASGRRPPAQLAAGMGEKTDPT